MFVCMCICMFLCMYMYRYVFMYIYVYMYVCMSVCVYLYIYTRDFVGWASSPLWCLSLRGRATFHCLQTGGKWTQDCLNTKFLLGYPAVSQPRVERPLTLHHLRLVSQILVLLEYFIYLLYIYIYFLKFIL